MTTFPTTVKFDKSEIVADIPAVEKQYNATFVGDFCIKDQRGNYIDRTVAIFWQTTPPVEGYSNYFGLFVRDGQGYITSGATAFDKPIDAIVTPTGEVVYSRYRHDFRKAETADFYVDGGRDYMRIVGSTKGSRRAQLIVNGPDITIEYTA